ncbi:unnamed protein product, partial [Meganyctiphanes norvegica]
ENVELDPNEPISVSGPNVDPISLTGPSLEPILVSESSVEPISVPGSSVEPIGVPISSTHTSTLAVKPSPEWQSLNGYGYYISTEIKTWDESKTFCETQNASFAQPIDEAQVLDLANLLKDRIYNKFWVGANNRNTPYSWLNGNEVTEGWRKNQPDSNKTGRCVLISYEGENSISGLSVRYCGTTGHTNRFICQIAQSHTTATTTGTGTPTIATSH